MKSSAYISQISHSFSTYVLEQRAIPSITDGLKMSQRIMLWCLRGVTTPTRTVSIVGESIKSKLYNHGDASAGETISRMASPYLNNYPLVQGEGNFGTKIAPNEFGAPRYTDVLRSKFAEDNVLLDLDILPMRENYDGSAMMPATFLPLLPLALLNGSEGVAVGWKCSVAPRRLEDVVKAIQQHLSGKPITVPLLPHWNQYDVVVEADPTTPNRYFVSAKVERVNTTTVRVRDIPPGIGLEDFRKNLLALEEKEKITDFIDNSAAGIDITVKFTRASLAALSDEALHKLLGTRTSFVESLVLLDENRKPIRYESPQALLAAFVDWRVKWYGTRFQHLLQQQEARLLYLRAIIACWTHVIPKHDLVRTTRDKMRMLFWDATQKEKLEIEKDMIETIMGLPIYRWTEDEMQKVQKEIDECQKKIQQYREVVQNPKKWGEIMRKELP